jgi:hypothetical protein
VTLCVSRRRARLLWSPLVTKLGCHREGGGAFGGAMIECVRRTSRNVKRWQSGEMALRWTAAGMLEAERQFRRIIGYRDLARLAVAIERDLNPTIPTPTRRLLVSSETDRHQSPNAAKKFDGEGDIFEEGACPRRTSGSLHAPSLVKSRSVPYKRATWTPPTA